MEHRILIIKSINKEIKNKNISIQRKLDLYRMRAFLNLEIDKFNSVISDSNKCIYYLEILNKEKNIPYEIKKIYNNNWISRIFLIKGIAHFRKGNKKEGTNDFIKSIDIYPKIIKEKTYIIEKLPDHIKSTFKYLAALK
ncbi:MAG: hypothetical protein JJ843_06865 [Prochlorococcus marinus CUG1434]|nr:hypothetical protein [Prochlorococcus marinus CUG1434]